MMQEMLQGEIRSQNDWKPPTKKFASSNAAG